MSLCINIRLFKAWFGREKDIGGKLIDRKTDILHLQPRINSWNFSHQNPALTIQKYYKCSQSKQNYFWYLQASKIFMIWWWFLWSLSSITWVVGSKRIWNTDRRDMNMNKYACMIISFGGQQKQERLWQQGKRASADVYVTGTVSNWTTSCQSEFLHSPIQIGIWHLFEQLGQDRLPMVCTK